jgi:hypothetical protein
MEQAKEATKTYIAMEMIDAGKRQYAIGEEIDLTYAAALPMLKLGSIVEKGDPIAAKIVKANEEKEKQDIAAARTKLEQRAKGEEPNNLGKNISTLVTSADPNKRGYRIITGTPGEASPVPKSARVAKAASAPAPVAPKARAAVTTRTTGGTKVSTGSPAPKGGKAPLGGKRK